MVSVITIVFLSKHPNKVIFILKKIKNFLDHIELNTDQDRHINQDTANSQNTEPFKNRVSRKYRLYKN